MANKKANSKNSKNSLWQAKIASIASINNNCAYFEMANSQASQASQIKGKNKWGHKLASQANKIDSAIWQGNLNLNSLAIATNLPKARISLHLSHLAMLGFISQKGNGNFEIANI